jgi:hypothetical protein
LRTPGFVAKAWKVAASFCLELPFQWKMVGDWMIWWSVYFKSTGTETIGLSGSKVQE